MPSPISCKSAVSIDIVIEFSSVLAVEFTLTVVSANVLFVYRIVKIITTNINIAFFTFVTFSKENFRNF